jgi:ABC-type spermidine/putrescine transport system permease subunit I
MIFPILAEGLTAGGWLMMILSVGSVTTLFLLCLYKVLKGPKQDA